mgnify:CR=1 FL=1
MAAVQVARETRMEELERHKRDQAEAKARALANKRAAEDAAAAKEDDAGKEEAGADPAAETAEKSGDDVQDDAAPEGDVEMKD